MDLGLNMQGGTLQRIPPTATKEQQAAALNGIIDRLNSMLKSQTFSDGSNRRMIIGYQKDGWGTGQDFGIKVSVAGVDVNRAADSELLFKMDLETWYFYDAGTQKNIMQIGKLPDDTYGWAIAKEGYDVSEGIS